MEKVVFIVHTEYHLMETIGYITHYFPDTLYDIYIYVASVKNGGRIKASDLNFEDFKINVLFVSYEPSCLFSLHNKQMIAGIIDVNPDILFIFTEFHYWKQYLVSKLHKKGCRIILAPDGANVYSDRTFTFNGNLKHMFRFFLINFTNLTIPPLFITRGKYDYAYLKHIDEVWVDNASIFKNRNNHTVKETLNFGEIDSIVQIKKMYGANELNIIDSSILFIDQPVDVSLTDKIIDLINYVSNKTKRPVYIKMHPNSDANKVNCYKQNGFIILPNHLPAELYIQNLKDSLILSLFSTALFLDNKTCRFYWIYPIFDFLNKTLKIENPTNHILLVNNKDEII